MTEAVLSLKSVSRARHQAMKKIHRIFAAASALFFLTACTSAGLALINIPSSLKGGYTVHETFYGPNPSHKMDIYVPAGNRSEKKDVIVFFYGGRWQSGTKEDFRFVGAALARRGFVTVIPEFRKYPEVRFPVFVEDGAKALAWVDDHITEYGGQRDRLHLTGHSSGAHMAALLTVDKHYLAAENKNARLLIRDFAGLAGPYAFTPDEKDLIDIFGLPERAPHMRATTFIDGKEPRMLLLYGQKDDSVKPYNHERLAKRLRDKGGHVEIITYPGLGHIGIIGTFSDLGPKSSVVDDMTAFFKANKHE